MNEKQIRRGLRIIKNQEMVETILHCKSKDTRKFKEDLLNELIKVQECHKHNTHQHNTHHKSHRS